MKLLHVVPSYLPAVRYGGPIWAVHGLCRALVRRGHQVSVLTTNVDGPTDSLVPFDRPVVLDGVEVHYFPSRHLRRLYWSPQMGGALRRRIREFDLVHCHSIFLWPTWAAAREARRAGTPYLVAPRGMLAHDLIRKRGTLRKRTWICFVERRNLERAAGIHATSDLEAKEIRSFGFRLPPIFVVPNGVDCDPMPGAALPRSGLPPLPPGPLAVFIGRVNWKKGLDRLIEALPYVPAVNLIVAGNDEDGYADVLRKLATERGVEGRTFFVGPLYGEDKARLLQAAAVFVLPSYGENFGNSVLEAMAAGVAVVVSPEVGLAQEVSATGAGLVVAGEPSVLGRRLDDLLANPEERRLMGERGRRAAVERFSWEAAARRMEAVLEEVLNSWSKARSCPQEA